MAHATGKPLLERKFKGYLKDNEIRGFRTRLSCLKQAVEGNEHALAVYRKVRKEADFEDMEDVYDAMAEQFWKLKGLAQPCGN